jgi:mercuric ion binding protein
MKSKLFLLIFSLTVFSSVYSGVKETATTQLVTDVFSVEKMTCKMCHITIKMAIEKVAGVDNAHVDFNTKTATVQYNSSIATSQDIELASTNAGYPAKLQENSHE